ncbi:MAG TPA: hypothetical protein VG478_02235 [Acidimicrobiales bacterium]|jgi:hypothetical protein|nr:hypothetical protein [Acidimicrobiales bacterium]
MREEPDSAPEGTLLDRLDDQFETLRLLRADDDETRGRLLEQMGARGRAEQDIVRQLSTHPRPLAQPDRFPAAHRVFVRGLEVLYRNGTRAPTIRKRLGPLKPAVTWLVQIVTRWIVKSQLNTVVDRVRRLYELREANAVWGSDEHHQLRRARLHMQTISGEIKGKPLGVPAFLVGGAFISGVFSALQGAIESALGHPVLVVILVLILVALLVGAAWSVLSAAAISRRRIRLSIDEPLQALYETIGSAGDPPEDQSYQFAIFAIVFFALAAIVVPAGIVFLANAL